MKGDFSRDTFDPAKHFSRVLMQQGRVLLDADFNEQAAIVLSYLRALATDLIGPHGGPGDGFKISRIPAEAKKPLTDLRIGAGHYYVGGILCESERDVVTYFGQRDYPISKGIAPLPKPPFLAYLDVWERYISAIEDDSIRETALGGPDTCSRAQVVWQVKLLPLKSTTRNKSKTRRTAKAATEASLTKLWCEKAESALHPLASGGNALLRARTSSGNNANASQAEPSGNYRGAENRLYRVEIHHGGSSTPTFKWSRENGSVVFPITKLNGAEVTVGETNNRAWSLRVGDWVEIVDDDYVRLSQCAPLLQVRKSDVSRGVLTLTGTPSVKVAGRKHPLLRRWEGWQQIPRKAGKAWIELEDGVQIQFASPSGKYRTGDYWMIPARTATGDIEWPKDDSIPAAMPPAGVKHYYAPLAVLAPDDKGNTIPIDLRRVFQRLA